MQMLPPLALNELFDDTTQIGSSLLKIDNHGQIADYFGYITMQEREFIRVLYLDYLDQVLMVSDLTSNKKNSVAINLKEVFCQAIKLNCKSIALLHNHPSGKLQPSKSDLKLTRRIAFTSKLLGINLIDHIIVGDEKSYFSFAESHLISS